MADRIDKVNSLLQQEVGKILLRDFAFSPEILVTLTRVETTGNLIEAKCYISVFPDSKADGIINALQKSVYDIQYKINRTLRMRPIPKIKFVKETEIAKAAKIEELIYRANEETNKVESIEKEEKN
ncbi:MAG: 30S ribosome-binding factor RbfA [Candidatus Staskawiczbacteria bacterium]|nr:30S ribosome-binding factor RbfA [Candidatus Staskawiczbacteria bacterium]